MQRRAVDALPFWRVENRALSTNAAPSDGADAAVLRFVERIDTKLRTQYGGTLPPPFVLFSETMGSIAARDQFGRRELQALRLAWLRWGEAADAPKAPAAEVRNERFCRANFYGHVDAHLRVWWAWTEIGRKWWIEVTFDNRTSRTWVGEMGGTVQVTGHLEDPFGDTPPDPGPGRVAELGWGASSADMLWLEPGSHTWTVAPDADWDVHTTADGTFRVTAFEAGVGPPGGPDGRVYSCPVPSTGDHLPG
jgi:hypothetical protein